eukprot:gene31980-40392_t
MIRACLAVLLLSTLLETVAGFRAVGLGVNQSVREFLGLEDAPLEFEVDPQHGGELADSPKAELNIDAAGNGGRTSEGAMEAIFELQPAVPAADESTTEEGTAFISGEAVQ